MGERETKQAKRYGGKNHDSQRKKKLVKAEIKLIDPLKRM
jgi:hypothetical protein